MLNKLFTKCFYSKPTVYSGEKSIILNFEDGSEKFVVIQLSKYSSYNFYIQEEGKKKYLLCFEGNLLSGTSEVISVDFEDEDDAKEALQKVLVSLNGKTKSVFKIALVFTSIFVILFTLIMIMKVVVGFFNPEGQLTTQQLQQMQQMQLSQPKLEMPPFAQTKNGQNLWGLSQQQQKELAETNGVGQLGTPDATRAQYAADMARKLQEANSLTDQNLENMRNNRDALVNGGDPYASQTNQAQAQSQAGQKSAAEALINSLKGN